MSESGRKENSKLLSTAFIYENVSLFLIFRDSNPNMKYLKQRNIHMTSSTR